MTKLTPEPAEDAENTNLLTPFLGEDALHW